MLLTFEINKQLIQRTDCEIPVSKSENYLYAQFSFSEEWRGIKTAIFNNGTAYNVILDENNSCLVPWEVITESGFSVSVFCGQRITANSAFVPIIPSGYIDGQTPQPPTPDVYEQLQTEINSKLDKKQGAENNGKVLGIDEDGNVIPVENGGGVTDYNKLTNKPSINNVELTGNKSLSDLGIQPAGSYATTQALGGEATTRQASDNGLQNQIDAITVSSDVTDIVGTYADLQNYDTSGLYPNSIIKVLQDSTHSNALSYYRWVVVSDVGSWVYIGSEGPFYTKGEADLLYQGKVDKAQGVSNANKIFATDSQGNQALKTEEQITGRKQFSTNSQQVDIMSISKGNLDVLNRFELFYGNDKLCNVFEGAIISLSGNDYEIHGAILNNHDENILLEKPFDEQEVYIKRLTEVVTETALEPVLEDIYENFATKSYVDNGFVSKPTATTLVNNSTVTLADNTEYSGTAITDLTFAFPTGNFECYISLSTVSSGTVTITFPQTAKYIGEAPTFSTGEEWEISIKNGVIVAGKVE